MHVHPEKTLTRPQPGGPLRALFEQRFAVTVLSAFAIALVLLGVLFARTGETAATTPDLSGVAPPTVDHGAVSATAMAP